MSEEDFELDRILRKGGRECHACGARSTQVKACGRCNVVWYCNKEVR
jgi:hypothetical protein